MIAKEIVQKKSAKNIAIDWKISLSLVSNIQKDFVITNLSERYPDGWDVQGELVLEKT